MKKKKKGAIIMRKISCMLMILLLSVFLAVTAFAAESTTYKLDELEMSVDIPSNLITVTRDTSANDPNLKKFGMNASSLIEYMKNNSIYLGAVPQDASYEICLKMYTDGDVKELKNFNYLSDAKIEIIANEIEASFEKSKITYKNSGIFKNSYQKYFKGYFETIKHGEKVYGLQYYTIVNEKAISFVLRSFTGNITPAMESIILQIVNSVKFKPEPEPPLSQSDITYADHEVGVQFTVPSGWREDDLEKEDDHIKIIYTNNKNSDLMFGYTDIWSQFSENEKKGQSRKNINNDMFSESEFKNILKSDSCQINSVEPIIINNIEYSKVIRTFESPKEGIDTKILYISHFLIHDGILYEFTFLHQHNEENFNVYKQNYENTDEYKDYCTMLSSIKYENGFGSSVVNLLKLRLKLPVNASGWRLAFVIIVKVLLTMILSLLPIIIYRYAIRRRPVPFLEARKIAIIYGVCIFAVITIINLLLGYKSLALEVIVWSFINFAMLKGGKEKPGAFYMDNEYNDNHTSDVFVDSSIQEAVPVPCGLQCKNCGASLDSDSVFCGKCGRKVM